MGLLLLGTAGQDVAVVAKPARESCYFSWHTQGQDIAAHKGESMGLRS